MERGRETEAGQATLPKGKRGQIMSNSHVYILVQWDG